MSILEIAGYVTTFVGCSIDWHSASVKFDFDRSSEG